MQRLISVIANTFESKRNRLLYMEILITKPEGVKARILIENQQATVQALGK